MSSHIRRTRTHTHTSKRKKGRGIAPLGGLSLPILVRLWVREKDLVFVLFLIFVLVCVWLLCRPRQPGSVSCVLKGGASMRGWEVGRRKGGKWGRGLVSGFWFFFSGFPLVLVATILGNAEKEKRTTGVLQAYYFYTYAVHITYVYGREVGGLGSGDGGYVGPNHKINQPFAINEKKNSRLARACAEAASERPAPCGGPGRRGGRRDGSKFDSSGIGCRVLGPGEGMGREVRGGILCLFSFRFFLSSRKRIESSCLFSFFTSLIHVNSNRTSPPLPSGFVLLM